MEVTEKFRYSDQQLIRLLQNALQQQQWRKADRIRLDLNQHYPSSSAGWFWTAQFYEMLQRYPQALASIEKANRIQPSPSYQVQMARYLCRSGDKVRAEELADQLLGESSQTAQYWSELATLLVDLDRHELSLTCFIKAAELEPNNARQYYNLAVSQRFNGDLSGAELSCNLALQLNSEDSEAALLRSQLKRQAPERNHIDELRLLAGKAKSPIQRVMLQFALAKEYEDVGAYPESFAALEKGAALKRQQMRYSVENDLNTLRQIATTFDVELMSNSSDSCPSSEPIFILGLPRTGTTLVERILSSHSKVYAAGELNNFAQVLTRLVSESTSSVSIENRMQLVEASRNISFSELGKRYLQSTRPLTGHTPYFIDKLPLNSLYVGLIKKALPRARIIHLQRDPMDSCYAMYKQLFQGAYPFSYSLEELGRYYIEHHRLMTHWHATVPDIYCLRYESLVEDFDRQVESLLAHCRLDSEVECFNFFDNQAASTTASAAQVRQPVYRSSVGKWRHYETQLQPLLEQLRSAGMDIK